jgi:hypothetical protein
MTSNETNGVGTTPVKPRITLYNIRMVKTFTPQRPTFTIRKAI